MQHASSSKGILVVGLIGMSIAIAAASSNSIADEPAKTAQVSPNIIDSPVVMRDEKADLLVGAHVGSSYVVQSQPAPRTTDPERRRADAGWFLDTLRFLERSSARTWRRALYVAERLDADMRG